MKQWDLQAISDTGSSLIGAPPDMVQYIASMLLAKVQITIYFLYPSNMLFTGIFHKNLQYDPTSGLYIIPCEATFADLALMIGGRQYDVGPENMRFYASFFLFATCSKRIFNNSRNHP